MCVVEHHIFILNTPHQTQLYQSFSGLEFSSVQFEEFEEIFSFDNFLYDK